MKKHYCPKCYNLIGIYKRTNWQRSQVDLFELDDDRDGKSFAERVFD